MTDAHKCQNDGHDQTGDVLSLLIEQRDLYAQLAGLAEQQRRMVTGEQAEQLLAILAERQKIVNRLGGLGDRLRPYQQDWPAVRSRMSEAEAQQVDTLLAQANALLSGIIEKDEADVRTLAARKTSTGSTICGLSQRRQAGSAYAASAGGRAQVDWTDV